MNKNIEIDFIGIGTQKSGTSWLHQNLKKLPEFSLLPIKELHYFDRHDSYPSSSILQRNSILEKLRDPHWIFRFRIHVLRRFRKKSLAEIKWLLKYFFSKTNNDWYVSLFKNLKGLKGEITPSYSMLEIPDIQVMHDLAPNAKLILLFRNPIFRAWSHYLHEWRKVKNYSSKIIDTEAVKQFINSKDQELRSDYEQTISNYLSVYPRAQLLICFYDSIKNNPDELMESIVGFVGGNTANVSKYLDLNLKYNVNPKLEMPEEIHEFLKIKYHKPIKRMAATYGGYFNVWLEEIYGSKKTNDKNPKATMML